MLAALAAGVAAALTAREAPGAAPGADSTVSALNLLDSDADDIQYFYASRLEGEPADGVEDVHFHPVEPRQVRAALVWGL